MVKNRGVLDIKENTSVAPAANSTKGILFPKVALQGPTILQPLFPAGTPTRTDSLTTIGMMVYNVNEAIMPNGAGLYIWDGSEWLPLTASSGTAAFTITDCSNIGITGIYAKGSLLTSANNYITLTLSVQKKGLYDIMISPTTNNGYYFHTSGTFAQPGTYTIIVPGSGMPLNAETDQLNFQVNGQPFTGFPSGNCPLSIEVLAQRSDYVINCSEIVVNGTYVARNALTADNTIRVTMISTPSSIGTNYTIQTDEQNGYSFSATGLISSLTQTVTLVGTGTPLIPKIDVFTISTNSVNELTCTQNIQVAARTVKIMGIGGYWFNVGNNNAGNTTVNMVMNRILRNTANFSPTGTYKVGGIQIYNESNQYDWRPNAQQLQNAINTYSPDIIVGGYEVDITAAHMNIFQSFIDKGGVVIYIYKEGETVSKQFIDNLFYNGASTVTINTGESHGTDYAIPWLNADHPIMRGPFLNLYPGGGTSYYMQQDGDGNGSVSVSGNTNIQNATVLVNNPAGTGARVFVHNTKGLLWIGDGGAIAGASDQLSSIDSFPVKVDNAAPYGTPHIGAVSSTGKNLFTTNAHFFANVFAWAMDYVQVSRPLGTEQYNLP